MKVTVNSNSKNLSSKAMERLSELSNGIYISPINSDTTPVAWDAGFEIVKESFRGKETVLLIIDGGVDCSGFGSVNIKLPLDKAHLYYQFEVEVNEEEDEVIEELNQIFSDFDWIVL